MRVVIDNVVHASIVEFYEYAKRKYCTLDGRVVIRKMQRIYEGLEELGKYAFVCPNVRLRKEWLAQGYRECIIEDFHFAFEICLDEGTGEYYVYVHDVCHSSLYRE